MTRIVLMLSVFMIAISVVSAGTVKRQVSHEFKNKNYYLESLLKANFFNAFMYCQRNGMQLVTIESIEEYNYLYKLVTTELNFGPSTKVWISGTDIAKEGKFDWLPTGFPVKINKWLPGQPDNYKGIEHCMEFFYYKGSIGLNDDECSSENYFICQSYK